MSPEKAWLISNRQIAGGRSVIPESQSLVFAP
jgi:hypothetical protein